MKDIISETAHVSNYEPDTIYDHAEGVIMQALFNQPLLADEHKLSVHNFTSSEFKILFSIIESIKSDKLIVSEDLIIGRLKASDNFDDSIKEIVSSFSKWCSISPNLGHYIGLLKEREFSKEVDDTFLKSNLENISPQTKATKLIESISDLVEKYAPPKEYSFDDDIAQVLQVADDAVHGIFPHSLSSGFAQLDRVLGEGILDDYLWVFGAQSHVGKTTFALNVIRHIAMHHKHSSVYVSLEMGRIKLMRWFLSACTSIPSYSFTNGKITPHDFEKISNVLNNQLCPNALDILMGDTDINSVLSRLARHVKRRPDCRFIVVDHFHMLTHTNMSNPFDAQKRIADALKAFTLKYKVPILLLAQFKKEDEATQKRDPIPGDINGSSAIMTNADVLMLAKNDTSMEYGSSPTYRFIKIFTAKNRSATDYNVPFVRIGNLKGTLVMVDRPSAVPNLYPTK